MYNGIVLVDKPEGFTSFDVVAKLRGIFGTKKIGHTGTLDPMATGVLCICVGRATKAAEFLTSHDKAYRARLLMGRSTDTGDITGETVKSVPESELSFSDEKIKEAIAGFTGTYDQLPPMYSAKKVGGKKLYELARQGKTVERRPVSVTIYSICDVSFEPPEVSFTAHVSSGTYIRVLCEDIAEKLGVPGTMSSLRRISLGQWDIEDCHSIDELQRRKDAGELDKMIIPVDEALASAGPKDGAFVKGRLYLPREIDSPLKNGAKLLHSEIREKAVFESISGGGYDDISDGQRFLLYSFEKEFIGVYAAEGEFLRPLKMFYRLEG